MTPSVADLILIKDSQATQVIPGMTITYTLSYSNVGTATATGVIITETVPMETSFVAEKSSAGWQCTTNSGTTLCTYHIGDVAINESGVIVFAIELSSMIHAGDLIINQAQIGTRQGQAEVNMINNEDRKQLIVQSPTGLKTGREPLPQQAKRIYLPSVQNE